MCTPGELDFHRERASSHLFQHEALVSRDTDASSCYMFHFYSRDASAAERSNNVSTALLNRVC